MQDADAKIVRNASDAEMILIGKVTSVGPSPGGWSGVYAAWQRVDYEVLRILKKSARPAPPLESLTVFHLVVSGSITANTSSPRLLESIFHPGAELILFVRERGSRYEVFDENHGVLPDNPLNLEKVERALHRPAEPAQQ